jgi:lipopolysaccharide/colanic/teichoic acid biosynthesis glycosyltransferase
MPSAIPFWKRPLDVALVLLSVPLFLPVALAITLGILIVSPGPVFYTQERVGYRGRRFKCWKFRRMKVARNSSHDAVHQSHSTDLMRKEEPWMKLDKHDPRVIPLGRLLRATGLDELPQLYNILRGDMSVVGPRPCTPYEFDQHLPWQKERFACLPGLTGLWQVSGKNHTTFVEMVCLDIQYANQPSMVQDLKIIFRTIPTLLEQICGVVQKPLRKKRQQKTHGPDFIPNGHANYGPGLNGHAVNGHANGNGAVKGDGNGAVALQPEPEHGQEVIRSNK